MINNKYTPTIEKLEKEGKFFEHVVPVNSKYKEINPEKFKYLPKNIFFKFCQVIAYIILLIFVPIITLFGVNLRIKGRKKLKALKGKGAILVSNHVIELEVLSIRQINLFRKLYYIVLKETYFKGFLGFIMRLGGTLPLSEDINVKKQLEDSVDYITSHGGYLTMYAEHALWRGYTRIRPFQRGAFYFSAKYGTPIVPVVTLFRKPTWFDKLIGRKYVTTMQILDPIYPDSQKAFKQNVLELNEKCHSAMVKCATDFYGEDADATHYVDPKFANFDK